MSFNDSPVPQRLDLAQNSSRALFNDVDFGSWNSTRQNSASLPEGFNDSLKIVDARKSQVDSEGIKRAYESGGESRDQRGPGGRLSADDLKRIFGGKGK